MREISTGKNEAGKRLDKILKSYLREASPGLIYKSLRKKNILLNGARAGGKELLRDGDVIRIYFAEETLRKLTGEETSAPGLTKEEQKRALGLCGDDGTGVRVLYEDDHLIAADKPAGVLSQKDTADRLSLNEWLTAYLLERGVCSEESLRTFRPAVLHRLDRNTSGIVLCAKTLPAATLISRLLREQTLFKEYRAVVHAAHDADKHLTEMKSDSNGKQPNSFFIFSRLCPDPKDNRMICENVRILPADESATTDRDRAIAPSALSFPDLFMKAARDLMATYGGDVTNIDDVREERRSDLMSTHSGDAANTDDVREERRGDLMSTHSGNAANTDDVRTERRAKGESVPALTYVRVLTTNGALSYLSLTPVTGRKHQLRAHLSAIGCPILFDAKYGDPAKDNPFRTENTFVRHLLHCTAIGFPADVENALSGVVIRAPLPADLAAVVSTIPSFACD